MSEKRTKKVTISDFQTNFEIIFVKIETEERKNDAIVEFLSDFCKILMEKDIITPEELLNIIPNP